MAGNWMDRECREADEGWCRPIVMVRRDGDELTERVECDDCGLPLPISVEEWIKV